MQYIINILLLTSTLGSCYAGSEICVKNKEYETISSFNLVPTNIGTPLPDSLTGRAIMANPENACKKIRSPPKYFNENDYQWFVVIR